MKRHQVFLTRLLLVGSIIGTLVLWRYLVEIRPLDSHPTPLPLPAPVTPQGTASVTELPEDRSRYSLVVNASLHVYNSRLGGLLPTMDELNVTFPSGSGIGSLSGEHLRARWEFLIAFPWPEEPVTETIVFPINGYLEEGNVYDLGQATAQMREYALKPWHNFDFSTRPSYSGVCRHFVSGYISVISIDPLLGEFQFFCQFDNIDYAQVSGRFWQ